MQIHYTPASDWPPLAWLAHWSPGEDVIFVRHGSWVETHPEWFCEAVWDGNFASGDFDCTDLVFGSGGRIREGKMMFVGAGSTVDRLHSLDTRDAFRVSNSLPCLLADARGGVDPADPDTFSRFRSIRLGLERYCRLLPTSAGPVRLTYYHNIAWARGDRRKLVEQEKPFVHRPFDSFERYKDFLRTSLHRLAENMAAPARRIPYRLLGTISAGYDSAAVSVLARDCGLRQVITFDRSSDGLPDAGASIADRLGLQATVIPRDAWRRRRGSELPFIAADAKGEDVRFAGAEPHLSGRVLLTGFHGDRVWAKHNRQVSRDIVRSDQSGLSLCEYRLRAGFLHCPVPFLGVRQIADVQQISQSRVMRPWDVGGRYNRPIPRRIVEEAGIPRGEFARCKQVVSALFFLEQPGLPPASRAQYREWLSRHAAAWRTRGHKAPSLSSGADASWKQMLRWAARVLRAAARVAPRRLSFLQVLTDRIADAGWRQAPFRFAFGWAMERVTQRYVVTSSTSGNGQPASPPVMPPAVT